MTKPEAKEGYVEFEVVERAIIRCTQEFRSHWEDWAKDRGFRHRFTDRSLGGDGTLRLRMVYEKPPEKERDKPLEYM